MSTDDRGTLTLVGVDVLTGEEKWRTDSPETVLGNSDTVAVVANTEGPGGPPWRTRPSRDRSRHRRRAVGERHHAQRLVRSRRRTRTGSRARQHHRDPDRHDRHGNRHLNRRGPVDRAADRPSRGERHGDHRDPGLQPPRSHHAAITAIDASTGDHLWTEPGHSSYGDLLAVGDGVTVVLGADNQIIAYELSSGEARSHVPPARGAEPQLIDGTSVVMLWEGELSVLSTTDGSTTWSATEPFRSPWMNSVASNGTTVFVGINSLPFGD